MWNTFPAYPACPISAPDWGLAQQCGYYDEAHMIKDFKQYAGITPQGYERLITGTKIPELEL